MPSSNVVISPDTAVITSVKNPSRASCASAGRMLNENDMKIIGSYIDRALSAKTDARPQFQKMIQDSNAHRFQFCPCVEAGPILPQPL